MRTWLPALLVSLLTSLVPAPLVPAPLVSGSLVPGTQSDGPQPIAIGELGQAFNVHRSGDLWFAGQFKPEDVAVLVENGITKVVTLRTEGELDWDEASALEAAGIELVEIPFRAPDSLTDDVFDELRTVLNDRVGPMLVHCGSANRVGGAWIPYRVLDQGVDLEVAVREAKEIGLRTDGFEARARAYVEARQGDGSVKPGINDPFKDPDLNVDDFVARFETESREIYASRLEIVKALDIAPGSRLADIGAGTGLFTKLFSEAVGPDGWVWAVDIAPRFLERIRSLATESNLTNVGAVLCSDRSAGLAPGSVDVAFVCDTYHHFEYPSSTLESMHDAIVPGGRLIVIDFERIPGQTREWLLEHVRAGKEVFRAEIEAAGFELVAEREVPGLEENYFLEFRKPAEPR